MSQKCCTFVLLSCPSEKKGEEISYRAGAEGTWRTGTLQSFFTPTMISPGSCSIKPVNAEFIARSLSKFAMRKEGRVLCVFFF